jgi:DNA topoisomerase-1
VKYGTKYASLKEDDPYTITLERALEVIRLKKEADANRIIHDFGVDDIQVLNGRYGPYITNKLKNARVPKDRDPKSLTLEECRALLEAAPLRPQRGRGRFGARRAAPPPARPAADAKSLPGAATRSAAGRRAPQKTTAPRAAARTAARATAAPKAAASKRPAAARKAPAKAKAKGAGQRTAGRG